MFEGELTLLRFEPLLHEKAHEHQGQRTDHENIGKNSARSGKSTANRASRKVAEIAGFSHDAVKKVKRLATIADEETKQALRRGEVFINWAYTDLMRKEHKSEAKTYERCHQEKYLTEFSTPSNRHGFSAL